jgi:hypothetical protein
MAIEVITKDDLQAFRTELLHDIKQILSTVQPVKQKQWLKSPEVRQLLKISPGTLQNLRINGTLRFTKIGSIIYYNYEDIEKLLDSGMNAGILPTPPERFALKSTVL